jgi:DNA polymerase-3 subunit gamma/tau
MVFFWSSLRGPQIGGFTESKTTILAGGPNPPGLSFYLHPLTPTLISITLDIVVFMSWPRQYRPTSIDLIALPHIREALEKFQKADQFPQAFLFAGPKGTGKTSTSRLIGSLLNPDLEDKEHSQIFAGTSYVVHEMDAASNRRIDDIRQLKDQIFLPPSIGQKSIYILDEAHMLTREAFNALLKILEEPPQHAVFILATTELHKIPDTIVSRCQMLRFRKAQTEELTSVLQRILDQEKIEADPEVLTKVATQANGSFRDAIKLLEFISTGKKKLTLEDLASIQHTSLEKEILELLQAVVNKDETQVVTLIKNWRQNGVDDSALYQQLLSLLHQDLLTSINTPQEDTHFNQKISHFLLTQLQPLPEQENGVIPFLALELKLLEIIFRAKQNSPASSGNSSKGSPKKTKPATTPTKDAPKKKSSKTLKAKPTENKPDIDQAAEAFIAQVKPPENHPLSDPNMVSDSLVHPDETDYHSLHEVWDKFLEQVKKENLTIAAILQSAQILPNSNGVTKVGLFYQFHKDQLEESRYHRILQECAQQIIPGTCKFEFTVIDRPEPTPQKITDTDQETAAEPQATQDLAEQAMEALM